MKRTFGYKLKWLAAYAAALTLATQASGATKVLTLTVTGIIAPSPVWQDGASSPITTQAFDFTGIAGSTAGVNVDSAAATVKLVNATAYPATVALIRPTTCSIGANAVANADVHFLNNATPVTSDSNVSITSNGSQTYALRFAAAGNYGDKSGAVSCSSNGSMTYSY